MVELLICQPGLVVGSDFGTDISFLGETRSPLPPGIIPVFSSRTGLVLLPRWVRSVFNLNQLLPKVVLSCYC